MTIPKIVESDRPDWVRLREGLWPVAGHHRCRSSSGGMSSPALQRRGIGRALVEAAEAHARAMGHHEIASDAALENGDGIAAHLAVGYEEVERVVCFRRSLRDA